MTGLEIERKIMPCGHPKAQHVPDQERRYHAQRCRVLRGQCASCCLALQLRGWRVVGEGELGTYGFRVTVISDGHYRRKFRTVRCLVFPSCGL